MSRVPPERFNRRAKIVAFDTSDQLISDLKEGWIDSLLVQNPFGMGFESVKAIVLKLHGGTPADHVDSGITIVNREDLETPEIRSLAVSEYSGVPALRCPAMARAHRCS
ncbi:MAG: hypothetical protein ACRD4P_07530, partial [Bryobacteraceae bacterium]